MSSNIFSCFLVGVELVPLGQEFLLVERDGLRVLLLFVALRSARFSLAKNSDLSMRCCDSVVAGRRRCCASTMWYMSCGSGSTWSNFSA